MSVKTELYEHRGRMVHVIIVPPLKGMHRQHSLCYHCERFKPDDPKTNCWQAQALLEICRVTGMVTPVYECPIYRSKTGDHT